VFFFFLLKKQQYSFIQIHRKYMIKLIIYSISLKSNKNESAKRPNVYNKAYNWYDKIQMSRLNYVSGSATLMMLKSLNCTKFRSKQTCKSEQNKHRDKTDNQNKHRTKTGNQTKNSALRRDKTTPHMKKITKDKTWMKP
jgi:hypothetical protein